MLILSLCQNLIMQAISFMSMEIRWIHVIQKIYVNDKAANISMDITPNGDFFSQSQDMVIDMRNTVNQSGDNKVSVSVLAVCGNGCEFKSR